MIITRIGDSRLHLCKPGWKDREHPASCRWRWNPKWKAWWTDNPAAVTALVSATGWRVVSRDVKPETFADVEGSGLATEMEMLGRMADDPSFATTTDFFPPVPEGLEYLPFQRAGIEYALARKACIIGDQMGLGKTIQAIGVLNSIEWRSALVLCPASLKLNWRDEARKWLVDKSVTVRVMGDQDGPIVGSGLWITNYEQAKKFRAALHGRVWDVVICDEAQYLANPNAIRTRVVLGGTVSCPGIPCRRFLALTGTPISNRVTDLWALLQKCWPERFGDQNAFEERYGDGQNLPELQSLLRSKLMVRRLKSQVLKDLPEKFIRTVSMDGATNEALEATNKFRVAKAQYAKYMKEGAPGASAAEKLAVLGDVKREMQILLAAARKETMTGKIAPAVEFVKMALEQEREAGSAKVIVFVHHHEMAAAMREAFGKHAVMLTGEDSRPEARHAAVKKFQTDPEAEVFIGSRAAESGITLTAARRVVMVEPHWNPSGLEQAEDRAHRIGQTRGVQVDYLVMTGTSDEDIMRSLARKRAVIAKAVN